MKSFTFDTLAGRFVLIIVAALVFSQAAAVLIIRLEFRNSFISMQGQTQMSKAVAVLQRLIESAYTPKSLADVIKDDAVINTWRSDEPAAFTLADIQSQVVDELRSGIGTAHPLVARLVPIESMPGVIVSSANVIKQTGRHSLSYLFVAVELESGDWFNIIFHPAPRRWPPVTPILFMLGVTCLGVTIAATWAASRASKPLNALAEASDRLTAGKAHEPVAVAGTADVRRALTAFNVMGARLQTTLSGQRELLAAIGHDLRTPITSLRIRTELLSDEVERDRMTKALDELQRLTEAALDATLECLATEEISTIDAAALVDSVCEDFVNLGMSVTFEEIDERQLIEGWPDELARALRNLIDNAVRYGKRARVSLHRSAGQCLIFIDDDGPGIAEAQLEKVFEPLVRLEPSRNSMTGGHGLGLHITRNIILAHRGAVSLCNRANGGLRASVFLPGTIPKSKLAVC